MDIGYTIIQVQAAVFLVVSVPERSTRKDSNIYI